MINAKPFKIVNTPQLNNKLMPLIALCLGFFMVIIDVTIVNVALPNMAKNLHGGIAWLQWVVDGYTLTFACLLLSAGNLADRFGAKPAFLWGLILFVLTSLGCGLATSFSLLTCFRLLQGIAAALLVPTSLALINASYENNQDRAKAIGIWAAIGGIAAAAGPILGGVLTAWFGWRAVFFVNIPIGAVGFLLTKKYVPSPIGGAKERFDFLGQILGVVSIAALAFSLIEAGRFGWFSQIVIIGFIIFIMTFIAFLVVEHRKNLPMFPLKLFRSKTFSVAIAVGMILNIGAYGLLFVLTLYFQQVREFSVLNTGFAFLPFLGVTALASYFGGKMTSILGSKLPMTIGLSIAAIGFLTLLFAKEHTPYIILILPLVAVGFGSAFTMPAATIAAIHAAPQGRAGIASGTLNASRQIGSLIGVAIFGTIINMTKYFISGMHITLFIGAAIFLCGCIATLLWVKKEAN
jgi:DHA2 family methylenomycin A resistance protein-like MFS transporter